MTIRTKWINCLYDHPFKNIIRKIHIAVRKPRKLSAYNGSLPSSLDISHLPSYQQTILAPTKPNLLYPDAITLEFANKIDFAICKQYGKSYSSISFILDAFNRINTRRGFNNKDSNNFNTNNNNQYKPADIEYIDDMDNNNNNNNNSTNTPRMYSGMAYNPPIQYSNKITRQQAVLNYLTANPGLLHTLTPAQSNFYRNIYYPSDYIIRFDVIISASSLGNIAVTRNKARRILNYNLREIIAKYGKPGYDYCIEGNASVLLTKSIDLQYELIHTLIYAGLCRNIIPHNLNNILNNIWTQLLIQHRIIKTNNNSNNCNNVDNTYSLVNIRDWLYNYSNINENKTIKNLMNQELVTYPNLNIRLNKLTKTQKKLEKGSYMNTTNSNGNNRASSNWFQAQSYACVLYTYTIKYSNNHNNNNTVLNQLNDIFTKCLLDEELYSLFHIKRSNVKLSKQLKERFFSIFNWNQQLSPIIIKLYNLLFELNCLHLFLEIVPYYQTLCKHYPLKNNS